MTTTTVSQEAVEVTQADRDAVAEFHRQSFKTLFTTTDADIDAGINRSYELLCQAFARHRQQAERGEAWRPIETAPKDGTVIDLWKLAQDGRHGKRIPDIKWDANRSFNGGIGRVAMSDAWVHADHGGEVWLAGGSFTHWQPLPTPPEAV